MTITVQDLSKSFGPVQALKGVNLTVEPGRPLVLVGANGAGKSTLLKILAGLMAPTSGTVEISSGSRVAYLPEDRGLFGWVTVHRHLQYFADLAGVADAQVAEWMGLLRIEQLAHVRVQDLSKGNQQKLQLASCLIDFPECALLDEPFSGLDPLNLMLIRDVIGEYAVNHCVIISAHHVDLVQELGHDIILLREGQVAEAGRMSDIAARHGGRRLVIPDTSKHRHVLDAAGISYCAENTRLVTQPIRWERARAVMDQIAVDGTDLCYRSQSLSELFVELMGE